MNLLKTGQRVKVGRLSDETGRKIKGVGKIISLNTNGLTGNTPQDPLYRVLFVNGKCESYWKEELEVIEQQERS